MRHAFTRMGVVVLAVAIAGASGLLSLVAPQAGGVNAVTATEARNYCPDGQELEFLRMVNNFRKANGRKPLRLSRTLGAAADHHSTAMAERDVFSHTLPGGTSWLTNIRQHGYRFNTTTGENIAAGRAGAGGVLDQWKASSGHRATMLDPHFRSIGIGRAYDGGSTYGWYWTTTFGGVFDDGIAC